MDENESKMIASLSQNERSECISEFYELSNDETISVARLDAISVTQMKHLKHIRASAP